MHGVLEYEIRRAPSALKPRRTVLRTAQASSAITGCVRPGGQSGSNGSPSAHNALPLSDRSNTRAGKLASLYANERLGI
eukprot:scaffold172633_cov33-Tisochrysis_lutea.AAC.3